jgi:Tfp pilus assembly protein PilN
MYVTLNISNSSLKVLSVKGRRVNQWGSLPLAAGLVKDGLILQPKAIGEAIDTLFKATKIPRERVITSLTALSFTYRFLSMPRIKPALLEEAIHLAARKEIPLPLDELYLSWQVVGSQGDEQNFFVVGVPRNLINTLKQTLTMARLEPYIMDLKPLALARAAQRGQAIIASLEPDCFDIVLVTRGIPAIMHTVSPKGEGATLEDNIRRLTDEIAKTVVFHQNQHPGDPLSPATPLLLAGELATEATTGLVQAELEYPVEPLVPPLECPASLPVAAFVTNMGLALKKIPQKTTATGDENRFHDININLLAVKYRQARARPGMIRRLLIGAVLVMAMALLFPLYHARNQSTVDNTQLQDEFHQVEQELNQARLASDKATAMESTISEITAGTATRQQALQNLLSTRGDFSNSLVMVTEALPPQACLTSIKVTNGGINLRGEVDSPFTVVSYATALEVIETISEVRIKEIDEARPTESESTDNKSGQVESKVITFEILIDK